MKVWLFVLLLCGHLFGIFSPVFAQDGNRMQAVYTNETIRIDGILDEAIWQTATRITQFTQRELVLGEAATERTEVAIAYDDQKIYIAVWCYDSQPDKLIARELRRDFDYMLDDNFMVILDTYHDKRNGFQFVTNPNGARADLQVFNNGGSTNAFGMGCGMCVPKSVPKAGLPNLKSLFIRSNTV